MLGRRLTLSNDLTSLSAFSQQAEGAATAADEADQHDESDDAKSYSNKLGGPAEEKRLASPEIGATT